MTLAIGFTVGLCSFSGRFGWLVLATVACSEGVDTDAPPQPVPLPTPIVLQIGSADTAYNEGTMVDLEGLTGRFRLAGTVSVPGPGYTIEATGTRQGLNILIEISTVTVPGVPLTEDLTGRSLNIEWEMPRGTYRILVQDDIKALVERLVEVQ